MKVDFSEPVFNESLCGLCSISNIPVSFVKAIPKIGIEVHQGNISKTACPNQLIGMSINYCQVKVGTWHSFYF